MVQSGEGREDRDIGITIMRHAAFTERGIVTKRKMTQMTHPENLPALTSWLTRAVASTIISSLDNRALHMLIGDMVQVNLCRAQVLDDDGNVPFPVWISPSHSPSSTLTLCEFFFSNGIAPRLFKKLGPGAEGKGSRLGLAFTLQELCTKHFINRGQTQSLRAVTDRRARDRAK
jgi:hypothetical protein